MPLSPTATRALLAQLGHHPKRFLGQNFLVDGNIVRKSLQLAEIVPGDKVVEIGPGLGTLTTALLEAGADVWAIERDATLFQYLSAHLLPLFPRTFHLLEGDAVEHPLAEFERGAPPGPPLPAFKIVANLPYAISTPWMDAVLAAPLPERMVLMLQKEAADRYSAAPGSKAFGAISIFLQAACEIEGGHTVSGTCFYPRPEIDSRLLSLRRKASPYIFRPEARSLIRSCFQQRRKQIGSIAASRFPETAGLLIATLRQAGFSERSRPEEISVEAWTRISYQMAHLF